MEVATIGGGCFWCVEAVFQRLEGIIAVESGYAGGEIKNPTYEEISTGTTGHAEVAKVTFDPSILTFEQVLEVFFRTHNPTTLNRQGNDIGTQYRSVIYYHNDTQKVIAERLKKDYAPKFWDNSIVTEISPLYNYSKAEQYHQNYYNDNGRQSYCVYVVDPKVKKFEKEFKAQLKGK